MIFPTLKTFKACPARMNNETIIICPDQKSPLLAAALACVVFP